LLAYSPTLSLSTPPDRGLYKAPLERLPDCLYDHQAPPSALDLARFGLSLIPLAQGEKRPPAGFRWATFREVGTTPDQVDRWRIEFPGCNWAVLLGRASGVIAVDVDSDDALAWAKIQGGFGASPISFTSGASPGAWLYTVPADLLHVGRFVPYPGLEIRATGAYSAIPPSVHPSGTPYQWRRAPQVLEDIPEAPGWVLKLISERIRPTRAPATTTHERTTTEPPTAQTARGEVLSSPNRALLQSHANYLLAHGRFAGPTATASGCRHSAAYCYALILKGAGVRKETALSRIDEWATRQAPAFGLGSDERPAAIVEGVWARPYRPQVDRLLSLVTIDGQRLTRRQAEQLVKFYPQFRPPGSWKYQPSLDAALRVIEILAKRRVLRPTAISLRELADTARITRRRVEEVAGFLDAIGIRIGVQRIGRSSISVFDLQPLIEQLHPLKTSQARARTVCLRFVEWRRYAKGSEAVLAWLRRRLVAILKRVLDALSALAARVIEVPVLAVRDFVESSPRACLSRAPPVRSGPLATHSFDLRPDPALRRGSVEDAKPRSGATARG